MPSRFAADDAAALAQSLAPIVAGSPALIWIKDLEGRYIHVNGQYADVVGVEDREIRGLTDADLSTAHLIETDRAAGDVVVDGRPRQYTIEARDQRPPWSVWRFAIHDSTGHPAAVCGVAAPLSDAAVAQRECVRLLELDRSGGWSFTVGRADERGAAGAPAPPRPEADPGPSSEPAPATDEQPGAAMDRAQGRLGELGQLLAQASDRMVELDDLLSRAGAPFSDLESLLGQARETERASLEATSRLSELENEVDRLSHELVGARDVRNRDVAALAEASQRWEEWRTRAGDALARVAELERQLDDERERANKLETSLAHAQMAINASAQEAKSAKLRAEAARLDAEAARLEAQASHQDFETARIEADAMRHDAEAAHDEAARFRRAAEAAFEQMEAVRSEWVPGHRSTEEEASEEEAQPATTTVWNDPGTEDQAGTTDDHPDESFEQATDTTDDDERPAVIVDLGSLDIPSTSKGMFRPEPARTAGDAERPEDAVQENETDGAVAEADDEPQAEVEWPTHDGEDEELEYDEEPEHRELESAESTRGENNAPDREDAVDGDSVSEDLIAEDGVAEDLAAEDLVADEIDAEDIDTEDPVADETDSEELVARAIDAEELSAEDAEAETEADDGAETPVPTSPLTWSHSAKLALTAALMNCNSSRTLLDEAVRVIGPRGGWDAVIVWSPEPRWRRYSCETVWCTSQDEMTAFINTLEQLRPDINDSAIGRAAAEGDLSWYADTMADGDPCLETVIAEGMKSIAIVPLRREGEIVAVIEFCSRQDGRPDEQLEAALVTTASELASIHEGLAATEGSRWGVWRRR